MFEILTEYSFSILNQNGFLLCIEFDNALHDITDRGCFWSASTNVRIVVNYTAAVPGRFADRGWSVFQSLQMQNFVIFPGDVEDFPNFCNFIEIHAIYPNREGFFQIPGDFPNLRRRGNPALIYGLSIIQDWHSDILLIITLTLKKITIWRQSYIITWK